MKKRNTKHENKEFKYMKNRRTKQPKTNADWI